MKDLKASQEISGVLLEKIIPLHTLCFQLFVIFVSKIKWNIAGLFDNMSAI